MELHPDLATALIKTSFDRLEVGGRKHVLVIGQLKSTERVAHFLVEIATLYNERHEQTKPLVLHIKRNEIADYLGLTLETVSRSFSKLKNRNVIALIESDSIVLLDFERLAEIGKTSARPGC